jgi:hypothetical protein
VIEGVLPIVQEYNEAVLHKAAVPIAQGRANLAANLRLGQYRNEVEEYLDDPTTFLTCPVFDGFGDDKQLAGAVLTPLYWRLILSNSLSPAATGIICVLSNSFNQTLSYRVDGADVIYWDHMRA